MPPARSIDAAIDLLERIREARSVGVAIVGIREDFVGSPEDLAAAFGLSAAPGIYRAIPPAEAMAVLEVVLHRDLAYSTEIVPEEQALYLANDFVRLFEPTSTVFYTNGTHGLPQARPNVGPGWQPATDATFDTGVLALGRAISACVWFKDED